jgi:Alpha amylase, catalytic domain
MNIFQINSRVLHKRQNCNLDCIDISYWQSLKNQGFDAVWIMGIWKICEYSITESQKIYAQYPTESIVGSCFAVDQYTPDSFVGDVSRLKANLNSAGLKLILDFIPNHFGRMGKFFVNNSDLFLQANAFDPSQNFEFEGKFYNLAKDPHYEPWSDVAQLDYSKPETIKKMQQEIIDIAKLCDGVRCDMTMLLLPEIFEQTCGIKALDFWHEAIAKVKVINPNFVFMAEVYWNLEQRMIDLGFDLVYNKSFLDSLIQTDENKLNHAKTIIATGKSLIFLENHDEPRINSIFEPVKVKELTDFMYSMNSSVLIQDGQLEGAKERLPIQVC